MAHPAAEVAAETSVVVAVAEAVTLVAGAVAVVEEVAVVAAEVCSTDAYPACTTHLQLLDLCCEQNTDRCYAVHAAYCSIGDPQPASHEV